MGSRANAYLELSVFIAQYEEYTQSLIEHLSERKVGHWDLHVRELTAKALNRLASVAPCYLAENVMPKLLKNIESSEDLYLKHGSILAIGELSLGLSNEAQRRGKNLTEYFGESYQIYLALVDGVFQVNKMRDLIFRLVSYLISPNSNSMSYQTLNSPLFKQ